AADHSKSALSCRQRASCAAGASGKAPRALSRDQMVGACRSGHAHRMRPDGSWHTAWRPRRHRRRSLAGMVAGRLRRPTPRRHQLRPLSDQCARRGGSASVLIAEDQEHVDKVLPMLDRLPGLRKLVVIDDSNMFGYRHAALLSLRELIELGNRVSEDDFARRRHAVRPDDPATIVYTSGPSAHPKGALYTHRALITLGNQFHAFEELDGSRDIRSVVHLPQSPVRAREYAARHACEGDHSPFQ